MFNEIKNGNFSGLIMKLITYKVKTGGIFLSL